jgi:hypothetical protein
MGAENTDWLRSDCRLSYSGSGQVESDLQNNSKTFQEPPLQEVKPSKEIPNSDM